ncbi:MAG: hypothetical protein R6V01_09955 [Thermoplasmatota archaeon]
MVRKYTPFMILPALVIAVVLLLVANGTNATPSGEKRALIIVSEYDGSNQYEVNKAAAYYDHLIEEGFSSENMVFLCMSDHPDKDGNSSLSNVESSFKDLIDDSSNQDDVRIYVSDNVHVINSDTHYQFSGGQLPCNNVIGWVEEMKFSSLDYLNLGNHSGLFGRELAGPNRVIISSMREYEETPKDKFDITRGYDDPNADTNGDGTVSTEEAFYSERIRLEGTDQTPIMW